MSTFVGGRTGAPLSFGQEQLWFLDQLVPGQTTYNILLGARLRGALDLTALRRSLTAVVGRHEALRVRVESVEGVPYQTVAPPPTDIELRYDDYSDLPPSEQQVAMQAAIDEQSGETFDLQVGPLYRYRVLRLDDEHHVLLQNLHHIVTDGWSSALMNNDISTAYRAFAQGREPEFDRSGSSYLAYAEAQREFLQGETLSDELDYWAGRLADLPTLDFPTDRPRPATPTRRADSVIRTFPTELLVNARALAVDNSASLYMVLAAALNVVLCRITGQEDIAIGVPMLSRVDPDLEDVVGLFVNMLVLRSDLSGDPSFEELIGRIMDASLDLYEHQEVPFHLIVDRVQPERDPSRNPLFQIAMQVLGAANSGGALSLPGLTSEAIPMRSAGSRFDMAIDFIETEDSLRASVEFSTDLFDHRRIDALLTQIENVITDAAADPGRRLSQLTLVGQAERAELIRLGKGKISDYDERPLHVGFAETARATPDAPAVICRGVTLTYAELDRRADLLARCLRARGVEHGQVIAVVLDRDLDAYVTMIGVLKAGAAFAMMDPKTPAARLAFMIEDTRAPIVVSRAALADRLPDVEGVTTLLIDAQWADVESAARGVDLDERATRESMAYVLYTSGSTGTPKGVMIAHRAVSFFCESYRQVFDLGPGDRLLQLPALNFDMSQGEIWSAFLVGGTIVAVSPEDAQSPEALSALLRDERVTYAGLPPAMQSVMDAEPYPDLKYVMGGAEVLPPALVNKWNLPGRKYLNLYGPTECAIGQTDYVVEKIVWTKPPPIGRPQLNRQVYVVDRWGNLVPPGVNGELLIGGEEGGLSLGYLNQPALTQQKFVPDPFHAGRLVYRSGDLVRWNSDGQLDFLGRIDNQVKLRGLRIELGEIETALQALPEIQRAVVLMKPDRNGENRLVGYFTSTASAPELDSIRSRLAETLPDYMVPTAWVALEAFPMNNDGWKINRNALPDPVDESESGHFVEPRTETEATVSRSIAEVLSVAQVGADDSFFDIGGNSLQALRVVSRINKTFKIKFSVRQLYGNATVDAIATAIDGLVEAKTRA